MVGCRTLIWYLQLLEKKMFLEHVQRPGLFSHLYKSGLTGAIGNRQQDLTDVFFSERTCICLVYSRLEICNGYQAQRDTVYLCKL